MADENPTGGKRAVPLDLPAKHIAIVRSDLEVCLEGVEGDLEMPERMSNPEKARREAEAYKRLLVGLDRGEIVIPDKAARKPSRRGRSPWTMRRNTPGWSSNTTRFTACSQCSKGKRPMRRREVGRQRNGGDAGGRRSRPIDSLNLATDRRLRRAVFVAVLRAHPQALAFGQLADQLPVDSEDSLAGYALACAVRELVMDGLLQSDGLHVVPTHAALFFAGFEVEL